MNSKNLFILALTLAGATLTTAAYGAPAEVEETEETSKAPQNKEGSLLREVKTKNLTIKFTISQAAQGIVDRGEFDLRDDNFSLSDFVTKLGDLNQKSLDYFFTVYPDAPVKEVRITIADLGEQRQTSSARALRSTGAIEIDVKRWHKMYRGKRQQGAWGSAIHEFTHIVNYQVDPYEDKYHRELTAMFFEILNEVRNFGWNDFEANYLNLYRLNSPEDVLNEQYVSHAPLRYLAYFFVVSLHSGDYVVAAERAAEFPNNTVALEGFSRFYLASAETGDDGFDDALKKVGFQTPQGKPLTIAKLRTDLLHNLTRD